MNARKGVVVQMDLGDLVGMQRTWQLGEARLLRDLERNRVARERAEQAGEAAEWVRPRHGIGARRTPARRTPAPPAIAEGACAPVG